MKNILLLIILAVCFYNCSDSESDTILAPDESVFNWIVDENKITGSLNPFPLALNPVMSRVKDVDFISDASNVAVVSLGHEIRVYPYQFISRFESVNDHMNGVAYAMTYCPITKSGIVADGKFKNQDFRLRASGYLFNDNLVLLDEESDTYWSQMSVKCIKGINAGEPLATYNLVEMPWKLVKENFQDALVFTNSSITAKSAGLAKKEPVEVGDLVYGVINFGFKPASEVAVFAYEDFSGGTVLKNIDKYKIVVIGNEELRFVSSYINDSNAVFKAVQGQFPIVMEDDNTNRWNVFGLAVSGPRKGQQLKSPTSFMALWWAWNEFYDDFVFDESS